MTPVPDRGAFGRRVMRRGKIGQHPERYPAWHPKSGQPFPKCSHRPWLGIHGQDATPPCARNTDLSAWEIAAILQIPCPKCGAPKYFQCGRNGRSHEVAYCRERQKASNKAGLDPKADRYIELSDSQIAWLSGARKAKINGEQRVRMPRSTANYHKHRLIENLRWCRVDRNTLKPCGKRTRGDGRERSVYRLNAYDTTLRLIAADERCATPKGRLFFIWNNRLVNTPLAVSWGLDAELAERMPEVWACNRRSLDPEAPMKPMHPAKVQPMRPAPEEIEIVSRELKRWDMTHTGEQAARILAWGRIEVPEISPEQMAEAISHDLGKRAAEWHRKNPGAQYSGRAYPVTYGFFSDDNGALPRGMAKIWKARRLAQQAAEAQAERRAAEATLYHPPQPEHTGTDPGPPPEFRNLRTRFTK